MAPSGFWVTTRTSRLAQMDDEEVVARAKAGCAQSLEYLLCKYRGFVESKARCYFLPGAEPEDVVQEGMIGLFKAIRDFRCDRRAAFRSFAELCVTRQIITAVKSACRSKHAVLNGCASLDSSLGPERDSCLQDLLADGRAADPDRVLRHRETLEYLNDRSAAGLSELESGVLNRFLEGKSYLEISGELGLPIKTVDNALQRARRKVARALCSLN